MRLVKALAVLVGAAAAALALNAWHLDGGRGSLDAAVAASIDRTPKLGVAPEGRFLPMGLLRPGGEREGRVTVSNQTADSLALKLRARTSIRDLNELLRVRVAARGRLLYDGDLGGLRDWRAVSLALGSTEARELTVRLALPRKAADGWQGRHVAIALELETEPA